MMIDFKNVSVAYDLPNGGKKQVLDRVSLKLKRGEMLYVVGPSGSGKTTLMRCIYMDILPGEGAVQIGDYRSDMIKPAEIPYLRRSVGVVFQDFQLLSDRNVYDNVAFALYVTGKSGSFVRERVLQALTRVGLSHKRNRHPHELSGGEQQRVVIARAIVNEPWILLADEPTGNLDPAVADDIMRVIIGLHRQGMTIMMATHDYRLVRTFPARTVAFMNGQPVDIDPQTL